MATTIENLFAGLVGTATSDLKKGLKTKYGFVADFFKIKTNRDSETITEDFFYFHDDPEERKHGDHESDPRKSSGEEWNRGKVLEGSIEVLHHDENLEKASAMGTESTTHRPANHHTRESSRKSSGSLQLPERTMPAIAVLVDQGDWDGAMKAAAMNKFDNHFDDDSSVLCNEQEEASNSTSSNVSDSGQSSAIDNVSGNGRDSEEEEKRTSLVTAKHLKGRDRYRKEIETLLLKWSTPRGRLHKCKKLERENVSLMTRGVDGSVDVAAASVAVRKYRYWERYNSEITRGLSTSGARPFSTLDDQQQPQLFVLEEDSKGRERVRYWEVARNKDKKELDEKNTEDFFYFHDDPPDDLKQRNTSDHAFEPWKSSGGDRTSGEDEGSYYSSGSDSYYSRRNDESGEDEGSYYSSGSDSYYSRRNEENKLDSQGDDLSLPSFLFEYEGSCYSSGSDSYHCRRYDESGEVEGCYCRTDFYSGPDEGSYYSTGSFCSTGSN